MRPDTLRLHETIASLGERLGLKATREVGDGALAVRAADEYAPRPDVVWSLPLEKKQRAALKRMCSLSFAPEEGIPLVAFEVEFADASTKCMQADIVNLAAVRAPVGVVVVRELPEGGLYRRLARVIRTLRGTMPGGFRTVLPLEASWVASLEGLETSSASRARLAPEGGRAPRGGERTDVNVEARAKLRAIGEGAGFHVVESYSPPILDHRFAAEAARRKEPISYLWDPFKGEAKRARKSGDHYTGTEIDLAWLLPLPAAIPQLLTHILERDPYLTSDDLVFPEMWQMLPVVGFEIEARSGKHAAGSLVNLSAHFVCGVVVVPDAASREALERVRRTYAKHLPLDNVSVWSIE